jgi:hypothetical protein
MHALPASQEVKIGGAMLEAGHGQKEKTQSEKESKKGWRFCQKNINK